MEIETEAFQIKHNAFFIFILLSFNQIGRIFDRR